MLSSFALATYLHASYLFPQVGVIRLSGQVHADERTAFRELARQLCGWVAARSSACTAVLDAAAATVAATPVAAVACVRFCWQSMPLMPLLCLLSIRGHAVARSAAGPLATSSPRRLPLERTLSSCATCWPAWRSGFMLGRAVRNSMEGRVEAASSPL